MRLQARTILKRTTLLAAAGCGCWLRPVSAPANPAGGSVASGSASFFSAGGRETITTSASTFIHWNSFNIGPGETTTFVQPSSSSVVWNQIGGGSPSQILGSLNANGYVILQNQAGFYVGGQAAISAQGLVMTTARSPSANLTSGGAWEFDAPPPAAKIINYGRIALSRGGSAFLIANDIENHGSILAPDGQIGLYAGEKVLLSSAPDGRGLSAEVTLPRGSVDNQGRLIADAGSIAALARTINQNGLVQADTVRNVNGTIELVAADRLNLGANSRVSAAGTGDGPGAGGAVTLRAGGEISDQAGSVIDVSGGAAGGDGGRVEISAPYLGAFQSQVTGGAAAGYAGGVVTIDPVNVYLSATPNDPQAPAGYTSLAFSSFSGASVNVQADQNLEVAGGWTLADSAAPALLTLIAGNNLTLDAGAFINAGKNWAVNLTAGAAFTPGSAQPLPSAGSDSLTLNGGAYVQTQNQPLTLTAANAISVANGQLGSLGGNIQATATYGSISLNNVWTLADAASPATLALTAGNDINLGSSAGITAGNNWNLSLTAGTAFAPAPAAPAPAAGNDGIYLTGGAYLQTGNGNLTAVARNDVLVDSAPSFTSGMRTVGGGNITVVATDGNVTTGGNNQGYVYNGQTAPYYSVAYGLGGISTAAGGNVSITAGGNVTSYLPGGSDSGDPGSGAFGAGPGNLTIVAGGNVIGNYMVANGVGSITAGGNVGDTSASGSFALGLITGSWNVAAPNGGIYLQEVRNPNGVFNGLNSTDRRHPGLAGQNLFNYGPDASVTLSAQAVTLTSQGVPRLAASPDLPVLYPPILDITAGAGGITLDGNVTLYPSVDQNLTLTTLAGGNLTGAAGSQLLMSDSAANRWTGLASFSATDHSTTLPVQAGSLADASVNVSGNLENLTLITSRATTINVGGNMINAAFSGENLRASDVTTINVGGQIYNQAAYAFVNGVTFSTIPGADVLNGVANSWDAIFALALDPAKIPLPGALGPYQNLWLQGIIQQASVFRTSFDSSNGKYVSSGDQGFIYNASTGQLGFGGPMAASLLAQLSGSFTILTLVNGLPVVGADGKFETTTVSWANNPAPLAALYTLSQPDTSPVNTAIGYRLGGPGVFDVNAGSISLGNSYGILSAGVADVTGGFGRYGNLASVTPAGASLNVSVTGDLEMLTSTIATLGGGDLSVASSGGALDLGTASLVNSSRQVGFGIYTAGPGNVSVSAAGDVNIDGSRIATYDGGNINVQSAHGNINVGSGGDTPSGVFLSYVDPVTGLAGNYAEDVFGSGIVATTLVPGTAAEGYPPAGVAVAALPGDIVVNSPQGDINGSVGGITQIAQDGSVGAGPSINLNAGSPGYVGNIYLGSGGVIGGSITANANGNITGNIISRQNSNITATKAVAVSVVSGGNANVSGGGAVTGVIVGAGGASVSGGSVSATTLGQNVSVNGGGATSTLGSSAKATSTSQAAAQQAGTASQTLANNTDNSDDQKKRQAVHPKLRRVKRVTVILASNN